MYLQVLWFILPQLSKAAFIDRRAALTAIADCLTNASVPQDLPGTTNFTQAIEFFNLRVSIHTGGICSTNNNFSSASCSLL
jgi:hypothetical protein